MRTWILGAAILAVGHVGSMMVSCSEPAPVDDSAGAGGMESGGAGGSGGSGGSGGMGGMGNDCSSPVSVEEYCQDHDCEMPEHPCFSSSSPRVTSDGCGYRRVQELAGFTDQSPLAVDVWDVESGELVYHFEAADGAGNCSLVGELPTCSAWSLYCDSRYPCAFPPHIECPLGCAPGCLDSEVFADCSEREEALCGDGGAGGQGGGSP